MTCACCGCDPCNTGPGFTTQFPISKPSVGVECTEGIDVPEFNNTIIETETPCDYTAEVLMPCSDVVWEDSEGDIIDVPAAYETCDCMVLSHSCTGMSWDQGVDEEGYCCAEQWFLTTILTYVYVFREGPCKWQLVLAKKPEYAGESKIVQKRQFMTTCTAEAARPYCFPSEGEDCLSSYDGCECNPLP